VYWNLKLRPRKSFDEIKLTLERKGIKKIAYQSKGGKE